MHVGCKCNRALIAQFAALPALQPEKVVEAVHKICGVRAGV